MSIISEVFNQTVIEFLNLFHFRPHISKWWQYVNNSIHHNFAWFWTWMWYGSLKCKITAMLLLRSALTLIEQLHNGLAIG